MCFWVPASVSALVRMYVQSEVFFTSCEVLNTVFYVINPEKKKEKISYFDLLKTLWSESACYDASLIFLIELKAWVLYFSFCGICYKHHDFIFLRYTLKDLICKSFTNDLIYVGVLRNNLILGVISRAAH